MHSAGNDKHLNVTTLIFLNRKKSSNLQKNKREKAQKNIEFAINRKNLVSKKNRSCGAFRAELDFWPLASFGFGTMRDRLSSPRAIDLGPLCGGSDIRTTLTQAGQVDDALVQGSEAAS